jgi:beta-barrel assembly-enhancing protease
VRRRRRWLKITALLAVAATLSSCMTLSLREEKQLGDRSAQELAKNLHFVRDRWIIHYVDEIGHRILAAAGPQPFEYHFQVVEDDELNAFALPAGYVYIHTGVILAAENVSELAGVIAHEIGHVVKRHVARNYNRQRNTGLLYNVLAVAASIFVGGYVASGGQLLGQIAAVAYVNRFSREAEMEADGFAVAVLPRAGYDPNGLVTFFAKLNAKSGAHVPTFLSSHPPTPERMQHAADLIAGLDLPPGLRVTDDGELEIIQRRIELLTGRAERAGRSGAPAADARRPGAPPGRAPGPRQASGLLGFLRCPPRAPLPRRSPSCAPRAGCPAASARSCART